MTTGAVSGSSSGPRICTPASRSRLTTPSYASSDVPCVDSGYPGAEIEGMATSRPRSDVSSGISAAPVAAMAGQTIYAASAHRPLKIGGSPRVGAAEIATATRRSVRSSPHLRRRLRVIDDAVVVGMPATGVDALQTSGRACKTVPVAKSILIVDDHP